MKPLLTYDQFINEMKITASPYSYEWVKRANSGLTTAKFRSIETNDDYEIDFSPWVKNEVVVEFSSEMLKSSFYAKSSPTAVTKIFATVWAVMEDFLLHKKPGALLSFMGSDEKRTRVYELMLRANPTETIHWRKTEDDGFFIALKKTPLTHK